LQRGDQAERAIREKRQVLDVDNLGRLGLFDSC
jgi:hypothetical protein